MLEIKDKSLCSGCHSCKNICPKHCIEMKIDEEGFYYPHIDKEECVNCNLCIQHCPIQNDMTVKNEPKAYACYNKNDVIRMKSSSGGMFSLFTEYIINNSGVVFGASFDDEFMVHHIKVDNIQGLEKLRGSKYVQSKIGNTYKEIKQLLNEGRLVYFSGTPCQIDGLVCYLGKEYDNLILQDIVCHGVPSSKLWTKYKKKFNLNKNDKVSFRNKSTGWSSYSFSIEKKNKSYIQLASINEYMRLFLSDLCLRPSCYNCHSKSIHRNSDITLADFWGIDNIDKTMNDNKGTSLVFINSEKGNDLFKSITESTVYKEVNIEEAIKYNPSSYQSVKEPKRRTEFMNDINRLSMKKLANKYCKMSFILKMKIMISRI
jgi:coenzyme F420-reducing hydrogenase beta subunit